MTEISELTTQVFESAIAVSLRARLAAGCFQSGNDVVALRGFVGLNQRHFAEALGISVRTLCWEQGRSRPEDRLSLSCVSLLATLGSSARISTWPSDAAREREVLLARA